MRLGSVVCCRSSLTAQINVPRNLPRGFSCWGMWLLKEMDKEKYTCFVLSVTAGPCIKLRTIESRTCRIMKQIHWAVNHGASKASWFCVQRCGFWEMFAALVSPEQGHFYCLWSFQKVKKQHLKTSRKTWSPICGTSLKCVACSFLFVATLTCGYSFSYVGSFMVCDEFCAP